MVSVDSRPLGLGRQNDDLSPVPALEIMPPEAPAEGVASDGDGAESSGEARPLPEWAAAVPLAACRRADSLLAAGAAKESDERIDHG